MFALRTIIDVAMPVASTTPNQIGILKELVNRVHAENSLDKSFSFQCFFTWHPGYRLKKSLFPSPVRDHFGEEYFDKLRQFLNKPRELTERMIAVTGGVGDFSKKASMAMEYLERYECLLCGWWIGCGGIRCLCGRTRWCKRFRACTLGNICGFSSATVEKVEKLRAEIANQEEDLQEQHREGFDTVFRKGLLLRGSASSSSSSSKVAEGSASRGLGQILCSIFFGVRWIVVGLLRFSWNLCTCYYFC
jgi:hypothetical protein